MFTFGQHSLPEKRYCLGTLLLHRFRMLKMPKRRKTDTDGMWINPHSNLNGGRLDGWDRRITDANSRYLELADVVLSPKKLEPKKPSE
jgi:hypothetical protein